MVSDHAHGGRPLKPRRTSVDEQGGCQVTEIFQVLGKAHMLDILHIFHTDPTPHRFVDLQERLLISPNTLSERLRDLVGAGLVTRTAYDEIPPRVDYVATEKALALAPVFQSLTEWSAKHDLKRRAEVPLTA